MWKATVGLLGVTGTKQLLAGETRCADGHPRPTRLESDLSEALKEFNAKKTEPLTLGGTLETPDEVEIQGASISDWKEIDNGEVNADL